MYFANTEMTTVLFIISTVEIILLISLSLYHYGRPREVRDHRVKWILILNIFMLFYNITSGFFPDPEITFISVTIQNLIAYFSGVTMSWYFSIFLYKFYDLKKLKFFAVYGPIIFLVLPGAVISVFYFLEFMTLTEFRHLFVIAPIFFGVGWFYNLTYAIRTKYKDISKTEREPFYKERIISVYLAFVFWASLPIIVYYGDFQILEHSMTNAGFLVMVVTYYCFTIRKNKDEYLEYLKASKELAIASNRISHTEEILRNIETEYKQLDPGQRESFQPIMTKLRDLMNQDMEKGWKLFRISFDHTNNNFFKKLQHCYPQLNEKELRHLAYIKMNLNTIQIADLLHYKSESLKTARYRLKQKLNGGKKDLNEIVKEIDDMVL